MRIKAGRAILMILVMICGMLVASAGCISQQRVLTEMGRVYGKVIDSTQSMGIENATITVIRNGTIQHATTTDKNGTYIISNIPASAYTLIASAEGYVMQTANITLKPKDSLEVNFILNKMEWLQQVLFEKDLQIQLAVRAGVFNAGIGYPDHLIEINPPKSIKYLLVTLDWEFPQEGISVDFALLWVEPGSSETQQLVPDPCTPLTKPYTYNLTVKQPGTWMFTVQPDAIIIPAGVGALATVHVEIVASVV